MAIHKEEHVDIAGGFDKQIEKSAMGMVFDILQRHQYQFPIKSVIRELVSNSLDAIKEREIARNILQGISSVSDYFLEQEGDIYADSRFDPAYYDLTKLSSDPVVYIRYVEGDATQKDRVEIQDNGVGLGGRRLEKYFSLG